MTPKGERLGEGFYKGKGLEPIRFHVKPALKRRIAVAGANQKTRLSLDKMVGKIVEENLPKYEGNSIEKR